MKTKVKIRERRNFPVKGVTSYTIRDINGIGGTVYDKNKAKKIVSAWNTGKSPYPCFIIDFTSTNI